MSLNSFSFAENMSYRVMMLSDPRIGYSVEQVSNKAKPAPQVRRAPGRPITTDAIEKAELENLDALAGMFVKPDGTPDDDAWEAYLRSKGAPPLCGSEPKRPKLTVLDGNRPRERKSKPWHIANVQAAKIIGVSARTLADAKRLRGTGSSGKYNPQTIRRVLWEYDNIVAQRKAEYMRSVKNGGAGSVKLTSKKVDME